MVLGINYTGSSPVSRTSREPRRAIRVRGFLFIKILMLALKLHLFVTSLQRRVAADQSRTIHGARFLIYNYAFRCAELEVSFGCELHFMREVCAVSVR